MSWYSLIKCKVSASRKLYHPVLLCKIKMTKQKEAEKKTKAVGYNKLIITLCKKCAEEGRQNECKHTDDERSFIGTWTTDEVKVAISKGYRAVKVYEVWHFDEKSDDVFKVYVRRFMKIKLKSSEYDFKIKEDEEKFRTNIRSKLGIDLGKLEFNAGLRYISKLCLNSLWGKFGQRAKHDSN